MDHSAEFIALSEEARKQIKEVSVHEAQTRKEAGAILIDVREDHEFAAGHAKGARHLGRGIIERDIVQQIPDKQTELLLYCGGGYRSALAANSLQKMGYTNVASVAGGYRAWKSAELPVQMPSIKG